MYPAFGLLPNVHLKIPVVATPKGVDDTVIAVQQALYIYIYIIYRERGKYICIVEGEGLVWWRKGHKIINKKNLQYCDKI